MERGSRRQELRRGLERSTLDVLRDQGYDPFKKEDPLTKLRRLAVGDLGYLLNRRRTGGLFGFVNYESGTRVAYYICALAIMLALNSRIKEPVNVSFEVSGAFNRPQIARIVSSVNSALAGNNHGGVSTASCNSTTQPTSSSTAGRLTGGATSSDCEQPGVIKVDPDNKAVTTARDSYCEPTPYTDPTTGAPLLGTPAGDYALYTSTVSSSGPELVYSGEVTISGDASGGATLQGGTGVPIYLCDGRIKEVGNIGKGAPDAVRTRILTSVGGFSTTLLRNSNSDNWVVAANQTQDAKVSLSQKLEKGANSKEATLDALMVYLGSQKSTQ